MAHDAVVDKMVAAGIEMTRENYLELAYLGNPRAELNAEAEYRIAGAIPVGAW